ncbi:uncharacterized protein At5g65660-like isoform X2 [Cryptomeria japonica]|uniref:uncharacterized protein At5g65660-like isoform X2 n=1 Tax=Cryptomeria japonica TaxID=3369 RepID=UPI0027D9D37C|nr:uncharacterized protein At5g65660-like isoform X2 [Cryptomeria japonica]
MATGPCDIKIIANFLHRHMEQQQLQQEGRYTGVFYGRMLEDISAGGHVGADSSRHALGFPLGTALVLLMVFGMSAFFSCCYHWEKITSLHGRHRSGAASLPAQSPPASRAATALPLSNAAIWSGSGKNTPLRQSRSSVAVMMPGDDVPKFVAMPSPHGFAPENVGDNAVPSSHTSQSKQSRS